MVEAAARPTGSLGVTFPDSSSSSFFFANQSWANNGGGSGEVPPKEKLQAQITIISWDVSRISRVVNQALG